MTLRVALRVALAESLRVRFLDCLTERREESRLTVEGRFKNRFRLRVTEHETQGPIPGPGGERDAASYPA